MNPKHGYIALAVFALIIATVLFVGFNQSQSPAEEVVIETIRRPDLNFSFQYPSGQNGYSLIESPVAVNAPLRQGFVIMDTDDYVAWQNIEGATEAPPSLSLFVFQAPVNETADASAAEENRITRLQNWATENQGLTSINLATTPPETVEIDGLKALHYFADGLYPQEIYLASYKGFIYMFVGQFDGEEDSRKQAFTDLMSTVTFE